MKNRTVIILLIILMGVMLLPGNMDAADQEILARIGKKTVTKSDLETIIRFYPENQQVQIRDNRESRDAILKNLVSIMVISDLARKKGYERNRLTRKQLQIMKEEYLTKLYLEKEVLGNVTVSDREAEDYYNKNKTLFEKPEQVRVRHILTLVKLGATDDEKKAAKKKAEDLLERVRKGEDFARLAGDHSDDPLSKPKGGDIGFIARGVTVPAFDKTAFALEPGKVSGIVETPSRYHIIKVEEKKKAEITPYREIKEEVTARALQSAQQDKVNSFIEKSFKDSGVRFYNAAPDKKN